MMVDDSMMTSQTNKKNKRAEEEDKHEGRDAYRKKIE